MCLKRERCDHSSDLSNQPKLSSQTRILQMNPFCMIAYYCCSYLRSLAYLIDCWFLGALNSYRIFSNQWLPLNLFFLHQNNCSNVGCYESVLSCPRPFFLNCILSSFFRCYPFHNIHLCHSSIGYHSQVNIYIILGYLTYLYELEMGVVKFGCFVINFAKIAMSFNFMHFK